MTLKSDLDMSLHSQVIDPAHHLTETNIWMKFNENCPKCSGDMEQT